MAGEVREGVHRDRKRARAHPSMRLGYADHAEEERSRQYGAAAAQQAEHQADDPAGADCRKD